MIVGIDEVGRGCWAGPVTVGAVALGDTTVAFKDSKQLSYSQRAKLAQLARENAVSIGIGWAPSSFIDSHGINEALKLAADRALMQINTDFDEIIIDGTMRLVENPKVTLLKKADQLINAVSAASIVAKVARDSYMRLIDMHFPGYGFAKHVGYGTKTHKEALDQLGPSLIHRMSFSPLRSIVPKIHEPVQTSGRLAEEKAEDYLTGLGFKIIGRNWKTKWCEVDIIASRGNDIHFVEVKYRGRPSAGRGLEYITKKKLGQMKFAAEIWFSNYGTAALQPHLSALEISGSYFNVTAWVPSIVLLRTRS